MTRSRGAVIVLVLAVLAVFAYPASPACACSCAAVSTDEQLDSADAVFLGVVREITTDHPFSPLFSSGDPVTAVIDVSRVYKGDVGPSVSVATVADGASCGYDFAVEHEYLIFARAQQGQFATGLCDGNLDVATQSNPLTGGQPPAAGHPGTTGGSGSSVAWWSGWTLPAVAALVAVGLAGIALWRWRRVRTAPTVE
jgi:hypothetical protein